MMNTTSKSTHSVYRLYLLFTTLLLTTTLLVILPRLAFAETVNHCPTTGVYLQVLGSGGPEVEDKRSSSAYLVWINGKARVLIDAGGGSALRFGQSDAKFSDLSAVVFTHFHLDHTADFPALIKSSFFGNRTKDLPVFGPEGNQLLPSTQQFITRLFDENQGVWPYMSDYLPSSNSNEYKLQPHTIKLQPRAEKAVYKDTELALSAIPVHHGPLPALAWKITVGKKSVVISGDMSGQYRTLPKLANKTDLLIAHHAVPEGAQGIARRLHMPPSVIGNIAKTANVKQLVLSHRMLRTLGKEQESLNVIRKYYKGKISFANDLSCYAL